MIDPKHPCGRRSKPTHQEEGVTCTNLVELRVYGLMRSGNHAIIEWILRQYSGRPTCFLNNIKHGDFDPYVNCAQKIVTGIDEFVDVEILRTIQKDLLIYSYEDRDSLEAQSVDFLESIFNSEFDLQKEKYLGSSRYMFDVLVIRDPFNTFASRLKLIKESGPLGGISDMSLVARNWKSLARRAINLIEYPVEGTIVVKYNKWVVDRNYRREISNRLLGRFNDRLIENRSSFGGGSSFSAPVALTGRRIVSNWQKIFSIRRLKNFREYYWRFMNRRAIKNSVFERWKIYSAAKYYQEIFMDQELLELSERLFGKIPGTRDLVTSTHTNKISG